MNKIKLAIASGKGGTGKTLLSTNLFHALQQNGNNVALVDCDAEEPNAKLFFSAEIDNEIEVKQNIPVIDESKCTFCGRCHEYCNYNAIFILPPMKVIKVIEELCHDCGACSYACNDGAITEKEVSLGKVTNFKIDSKASIIEAKMNVGMYSPVPVIKAAISAATENDVVILDSPPGTSCPFIQTVEKADFVLLITEPTPFGLSDLKQSVETLKTMDKPYAVVINRAGLGDDAIYNYLEEENISLMMEIPFDKEIAKYYSMGELVAKYDPQIDSKLINMFNLINQKYGNSSN